MIPFTGTPRAWDELITSLPLTHLLQTWEWSQVKAKYGWQPMPFVWQDANGKIVAAVMVLRRGLPIAGFGSKFCVLYAPKGPLMDWNDPDLRRHVLDDLQVLAKREGAIFIKMDPDVELGLGIPGTSEAIEVNAGAAVKGELTHRGWKFSQDQIQFRNTVLVDLSPSEEELLANMKQKSRYNIRLAQKKGVKVRPGMENDLHQMYHMYAETSVRDGFAIREEGYYLTAWRNFMSNPSSSAGSQPFCLPLVAVVGDDTVAAISVFYFAGQAIYLFGMSSDMHREKMPNHLLQWEAIRRAKALGCKTYNLWGAPNEFNENDSLWGVFRFKEGLGGYVLRTLGAWDFSPYPLRYKAYTEMLPRLMSILRARGRARTRQSLGF